jgi:pimeloyl-ACP methyl ester carboxylesterase
MFNRRDALKSAATAVGGFGLLSVSCNAEVLAEKKAQPPVTKAEADFVETRDGVRLFYRDWGTRDRGTGKPVVFLAPWGLHSDWWQYQMAYLSAQGLRCVAFDRRGCGRSSEPRGGYDFDTLSDDLRVVIDDLGLANVMLVSQSMGAGEAVRYMTRHQGHAVQRLAFIAPNTPFVLKTADNPGGSDAAALEQIRISISTDLPGVVAAALPSFFGEQNKVSPEMQTWAGNMFGACSLRVLLELQRMFSVVDFRPELRRINAPAIIFQGDHDTSTTLEQCGRPTSELIRGSELRVYENAAHGLPISHMARLNKDLEAFAAR